MPPPNSAGSRAAFKTILGRDLRNEMFRTAGTLCREYAPKGHDRRRVARTPPDRSRPPASERFRRSGRRQLRTDACPPSSANEGGASLRRIFSGA